MKSACGHSAGPRQIAPGCQTLIGRTDSPSLEGRGLGGGSTFTRCFDRRVSPTPSPPPLREGVFGIAHFKIASRFSIVSSGSRIGGDFCELLLACSHCK